MTSCEKLFNSCVSYSVAQVTGVDGPNILATNQETTLSISYYLTDGCGQFKDLEATSYENTTIVKLNAKYPGCTCPTIIMIG